MARWQGISAGTLAVVLALFPLGLEQCRAACVMQSGPLTHVASRESCHHSAANDPAQPSINPDSIGCAHRTATGVVQPAATTVKGHRSAMLVSTVISHLPTAFSASDADRLPRASSSPPSPPPLTLPLRV